VNTNELLSQFLTAIDFEIALIEKETRDQSYELLSGQKDERATGSLFVFLLADPLRLPEDAAGTLKIEGRDVRAMVVAQEGNRIWLVVESLEPLPDYLPSARLVLNETDLLRKLKEKVEELRTGSLGIAKQVFGEIAPAVGRSEVPESVGARLSDDASRNNLAQMLGSSVTYLWGPPGTGKTFSIAALVAASIALDETVLVTSHTHAAVEQALWALIEPPSRRTTTRLPTRQSAS
jgi:AAA domain